MGPAARVREAPSLALLLGFHVGHPSSSLLPPRTGDTALFPKMQLGCPALPWWTDHPPFPAQTLVLAPKGLTCLALTLALSP